MDKRTAITYIDSDGKWFRATKGAPEQVKYHPILDTYQTGSQTSTDSTVLHVGSKLVST